MRAVPQHTGLFWEDQHQRPLLLILHQHMRSEMHRNPKWLKNKLKPLSPTQLWLCRLKKRPHTPHTILNGCRKRGRRRRRWLEGPQGEPWHLLHTASLPICGTHVPTQGIPQNSQNQRMGVDFQNILTPRQPALIISQRRQKIHLKDEQQKRERCDRSAR